MSGDRQISMFYGENLWDGLVTVVLSMVYRLGFEINAVLPCLVMIREEMYPWIVSSTEEVGGLFGAPGTRYWSTGTPVYT